MRLAVCMSAPEKRRSMFPFLAIEVSKPTATANPQKTEQVRSASTAVAVNVGNMGNVRNLGLLKGGLAELESTLVDVQGLDPVIQRRRGDIELRCGSRWSRDAASALHKRCFDDFTFAPGLALGRRGNDHPGRWPRRLRRQPQLVDDEHVA